MAANYAYYYAKLNQNGMCTGVQDTSTYHPIPETVESFDDFQGQWYSDAAHTIPWNP